MFEVGNHKNVNRPATPNEQKYVNRYLKNSSTMVSIGFWVLVGALILINIIFFYTAVFLEKGGYGKYLLMSLLVNIPIFFGLRYFVKRLYKPIKRIKLVEIKGTYHKVERTIANSYSIIHFIGNYVIDGPKHWLERYLNEGKIYTAVGYHNTMKGFDKFYLSSEEMVVLLELEDIYSIDDEVNLGLLKLSDNFEILKAFALLMGAGMVNGLIWPLEQKLGVSLTFKAVLLIVDVFIIAYIIRAIFLLITGIMQNKKIIQNVFNHYGLDYEE